MSWGSASWPPRTRQATFVLACQSSSYCSIPARPRLIQGLHCWLPLQQGPGTPMVHPQSAAAQMLIRVSACSAMQARPWRSQLARGLGRARDLVHHNWGHVLLRLGVHVVPPLAACGWGRCGTRAPGPLVRRLSPLAEGSGLRSLPAHN